MNAASFNGVNLLDGSTTKTAIVDSFSRNAGGTTTTGKLGIDTAGIALGGTGSSGGGLLGAAVTGVTMSSGAASASGATSGTFAANSLLGFSLSASSTTTDLNSLATAIDSAIANVTAGAATLGQYTTTVNNQLSFTSSISDAITSGVGSLVDADMNVASTRLQALQTQQQLGIQALSIANQNSQLILKLFG